mmetsp:Transcript_133332/g.385902  ORF Transcript_133332/g.385902 Transcript_133332/m.385902 type:complete len:236 (+) Transcript_133332:773-1480(+)
MAACFSAFTTLVYVSWSPVNLPTIAMITSSEAVSIRSASTRQSPSRSDCARAAESARRSTGDMTASHDKPKCLQMHPPKPCSANNSGTLYMFEMSCKDTMLDSGTWQSTANFLSVASSNAFSDLQRRKSGFSPTSLNILTDCWQGLVFCSAIVPMVGTMPKWQMQKFSGPTLNISCCIASRNMEMSMSPMVPPNSIRHTSGDFSEDPSTGFRAMSMIQSWIASVTAGIICTVLPK